MPALADIVGRLKLDDPRRATEGVHARLRELIYSGALPAGLILSQVELSEALGVSRTPLREALRMLQEEGLIDAELNRRARVAGFEAVDVDATCASRIVLESLGMSLTLATSVATTLAAVLEAAREALADMESDNEPARSASWHAAHHRFHGAFTSLAPKALREQLAAGQQRADRYVRQLAQGTLIGSTSGRDDHRTILGLVEAGDVDAAVAATCQHIARTAVVLLADVAPEFEPVATRTAIRLVTRSNGTPAG